MGEHEILVGVVGPCGSGKSTLIDGLEAHGYRARHIAQEHSFVPAMWRKVSNPDVLIFLEVSYPLTKKRKKFNWGINEYQEQLHRLRHAYKHADLRVKTDQRTPEDILKEVLLFLENFSN
jgi:deoxyadenosine/deoxycytidine kinase